MLVRISAVGPIFVNIVFLLCFVYKGLRFAIKTGLRHLGASEQKTVGVQNSALLPSYNLNRGKSRLKTCGFPHFYRAFVLSSFPRSLYSYTAIARQPKIFALNPPAPRFSGIKNSPKSRDLFDFLTSTFALIEFLMIQPRRLLLLCESIVNRGLQLLVAHSTYDLCGNNSAGVENERHRIRALAAERGIVGVCLRAFNLRIGDEQHI